MTIKESLEQEIAKDANEFEQKYGKMFSEGIISSIKSFGRMQIYCNRYCKSTNLLGICPKDELAFREFVKKQGLNLHEERNSYGARMLVVTM